MSDQDENNFEGFPASKSLDNQLVQHSSDPQEIGPRGNKRLRTDNPPNRGQGNIDSSEATRSLASTSAIPMEPEKLTPKDANFDSSNEAAICKLCGQVNPHKTPFMVKCDSCGYWCHISCAGVTGNLVEQMPIWHCDPCLSPGNIADNPSQALLGVPQDIAQTLAKMKNYLHLYHRLPQPKRSVLAGILVDRINAVLSSPSQAAAQSAE